MVGGDEAVEPGAGADVDDALALLQVAQRERVADTGERLDRSIGQLVDDRRVVAEPDGERPTGVEVVGRIGIDGDGPVLVPHLVA